MKKSLVLFVAAGLFMGLGTVFADEHEKSATSPIELYACSYNEGMGPADMDAAVAKWNKWADGEGLSEYSAWNLVPFYSGSEQDFDFLWLGGAESGEALGRAQDEWIANGGKIQQEFNKVSSCDVHVNFAAMQFRKPPERENPGNIVVSFSDCNLSDGVSFSDIAPSLKEWAKYKDSFDSTAGIWVFFPAYGGGDEDFDFKYISSYGSLEEQGVDYDHFGKAGAEKGEELFAGKVSCDSSRVYLGTNLRMAAKDEE